MRIDALFIGTDKKYPGFVQSDTMASTWQVIILVTVWAILSTFDCIIASGKHHLTCQMEHEKLVHLEGEMIDFCRTVIHEEQKRYDEDERHNFSDIISFLVRAEEHNDRMMAHEHDVIENPLALFKLKHWLYTKWIPVLLELSESLLILKTPELLKLLDGYRQFIGSLDITRAAKDIADAMYIYNLHVHAVAMGTFAVGQTDRLSRDEMFKLVECLLEVEYYAEALSWLETGLGRCDNNFTVPEHIRYKSLLGAAHLKLHQYDAARAVYNSIVLTDPDNRGARSNLKLISQRLNASHVIEIVQSPLEKDRQLNEVKKYCSGTLSGVRVESLDGLQSRVLSIVGSNETIRIEELHRNPNVVLIHDLFDTYRRRVMINKGAEKLWFLLNSKFASHLINHQGSKVYFSKDKPWMDHYIVRMRNITYKDNVDFAANNQPLSLTSVTNYGAGLQSKMVHTRKTDLKTPFQMAQIGHYFIFLQNPEAGGELAFPGLNLRVKPAEGSAVFWQFRTPTGGVHRKLVKTIHCPVLIGAQWISQFSLEHHGILEWVKF